MIQAPMMQVPMPQAQQPAKGFPWLVVAIIVLGVVLVGGVVALLVLNKSTGKKQDATTKQSYRIRQRATTRVISSC
jgi:hypothetical protein